MGGGQKHARKQDAKGEMGHTDDIQSLCMSHDREWVATGQNGRQPFIFIWDAETAEKICQITLPKGSRSTGGIGFSRDKRRLAVSDMTDNKNILVYDLTKSKKITQELYVIKG